METECAKLAALAHEKYTRRDVLDGSIGAGGSRESGGRLVYKGSLLLMNPGEFSTVMFKLY